MAGRSIGAGPEKKDDKQKANEFHNLALDLAYDARPPHYPKAINEFGYTADAMKDLKIRDEVINNQKDIASLETELKTPEFKTVKDLEKLEEACAKANETYKNLHVMQGKAYDDWLRANPVELADFKKHQGEEIKKCTEALNTLKKAVSDAKMDSKLEAKITANIKTQQDRLNALPAKVDDDIDKLIPKLKNQKIRNKEKTYDLQVGTANNATDYIFVPYFNRKTIKQNIDAANAENKYGDVDAILGARAGEAEEKDIKKGYTKAKEILKAELERAEREPPHESWFVPFGLKDEDIVFSIHRYKDKNGQWYLEAEMQDKHEIRNAEDFGKVVTSILAFQKFAGCEKDVIKLSYSNEVHGAGLAEKRVEEMLKLVEILKAEKPPKELAIDRNAELAIMRCNDSKKRKKLLDGLEELRDLAKKGRDEINAKSKVTPLSEIKKGLDDAQVELGKSILVSENKGVVKNLTVKDDTDLGNALVDAKAKGGMAEASIPLEALTKVAAKAIEDNKTEADPVEKETKTNNAIIEAFAKEKKQLEALYTQLDKARAEIDKRLGEIQVAVANDANHPDLEKLRDSLNKLEQSERLLFEELQDRCDQWKKLKVSDIEAHPDEGATAEEKAAREEAVKLLLGREIVDPAAEHAIEPEGHYALFRDDVIALSEKLDALKPSIEANERGVKSRITEIDKAFVEEEKAYKKLGM